MMNGCVLGAGGIGGRWNNPGLEPQSRNTLLSNDRRVLCSTGCWPLATGFRTARRRPTSCPLTATDRSDINPTVMLRRCVGILLASALFAAGLPVRPIFARPDSDNPSPQSNPSSAATAAAGCCGAGASCCCTLREEPAGEVGAGCCCAPAEAPVEVVDGLKITSASCARPTVILGAAVPIVLVCCNPVPELIPLDAGIAIAPTNSRLPASLTARLDPPPPRRA